MRRIKSVGVVIVNINSGRLLEKCVNSLYFSNLERINLEIIVVDNNSTDKSTQLTKLNDSRLKLIKNNKNRGFGYACNQGVKILNTDYILFLNPDTEVKSNTIRESIRFLENNEKVSVLGALHRDENGEVKQSCSRTPTPKLVLNDIFGLSKLFPKIFTPSTLMVNFDYNTSSFVDQVMGAYMLMKRKVFIELNGFDTRFFVYYEDADFAYRARLKGYNSYYNSEIEIIHHGRGTTKSISQISLFYNLRSRIQFTYKHYGVFYGAVILITTLVVEPLTRLFFNLIKNPSEIKNTIIAFIKLYSYYLKK